MIEVDVQQAAFAVLMLPVQMTKSKNRYRDTGFRYYHNATTDESWVVCPRCKGPALVQHGGRTGAQGSGYFSAHRLTCTRCSYQRGAGERVPCLIAVPKSEVDACFGLPYWLVIDTRHGKLWAQNRDHLDEIEAIVSARIRERPLMKDCKGSQRRWSGGKSLLNVLPRWVKLAKNRKDVLDAIQKLRVRLADINSQ